MATSKLTILGSTGSIGTQTLSLVKNLGIVIETLTANSNEKLLEQQALAFSPRSVCAVDQSAAKRLEIALAHTSTKVYGGKQSLTELCGNDGSDTVLNAVVGIAGLEPTLAAIDAGKDIALANKETLVTGGRLVVDACKRNNVKLLPVDSEHSAIFQCLQDKISAATLRRIFLTASGGPFFGRTGEELAKVTVADTLKHPNWSMGRKITVDSATLMNKGLEVIEAMWLFSLSPEDIVVTVHRQSIVHSMVEFCDGSVLAQLGMPDMRTPIQYALTYPNRMQLDSPYLSIEKMSCLTFEKPDESTFGCLAVCKDAAKKGGLYPCAANAANERAVEMFLQEKIGFLQIGEIVSEVVFSQKLDKSVTLENIIETDRVSRAMADEIAARKLS
ncbi:MAG: 1-deoxy-D-xylulose-5-phosphate reductoisomerase [Oscillospiraceae bacterium]